MKKITKDLTFHEMSSVMSEILNGKNNDDEIVEFLKDLSDKGETNEELRAMFTKMNEYSVNINPELSWKFNRRMWDRWDNLQTFNISTAASFVIGRSRRKCCKTWKSLGFRHIRECRYLRIFWI